MTQAGKNYFRIMNISKFLCLARLFLTYQVQGKLETDKILRAGSGFASVIRDCETRTPPMDVVWSGDLANSIIVQDPDRLSLNTQ